MRLKSHAESLSNFPSFRYNCKSSEDTVSRIASPTGIVVEQTLKRFFISTGEEFDDFVDNSSVYDPEKLFDKLKLYGDNINTNIDEQAYQKAFNLTLKAFVGNNSHTLDPIFDEWYIQDSVKFSKASGAPYFGKKGETFNKDYQLAKAIVNNGKMTPPCVAYHRVQHGDEGPKVRLVWGYPQSMTILESSFARPVIEYLMENDTPTVLGLHRYKMSGKLTSMFNDGYVYGFDYSRFDATISYRLICDAFKIISKLFNMDEYSWNVFKIIKRYFINTPILMPDGMVYKKSHGVPSGSYFTNVIDSIINYLSIQYAFIRAGYRALSTGRVYVQGDDSIVSSPVKISVNKVIQGFTELGLIVHSSKCDKWESDSDERDIITFLGHKWIRGIVDRNEHDILVRMIYAERPAKKGVDPRLRLKNRVYPYVCDAKSSHKLIGKYSYGGGKPHPTYALAGQINKEFATGWMRYLEIYYPNQYTSDSYYNLCYYGILC